MKKNVFFLFFLVPHLMYASFETHACTKALDRIDAEWHAHVTCLMQFDSIPKGGKIEGLPFVKEAIECCYRAISHSDYILGKIEHKSKRERQQHYWMHVKEECKQYKAALLQEIDRLSGLMTAVFTEAAFVQSNTLYQQGIEKANVANKIRQECPRRLNNVEEVVAMLTRAIQLYEEASLFVVEALDLILPFPDEESKKIIQQTLDVYRGAVEYCHKERLNWPVTLLENVKELKEQLALLVAERDLLIKRGDREDLLKLEQQLISIAQQLVKYGEEEVSDELKQLLGSCQKEV